MDHLNLLISGSLFTITYIIIVLAVYSIRRKEVSGAIPFFFLCFVTSFYSFGYGMELFSQTIEQVDMWSKFQYLGLPFIPTIWVLLSISYSGTGRKYHKSFYGFLFLIPILTSFFRLTSMTNELLYSNIRLISNGHFLVLDFGKGPWYYLHLFYFIFCVIYSSINYYKIYVRAIGYLKQQSLIMITASLMTLFPITWSFFKIFPLGLDSGPFFVIFNYLLLTYGIFRYNMLHLIPLSREKVFDWIHDGVLVLDMQFTIVDFNRASSKIFTELSKDAVGLNVKKYLSKYSSFVESLLCLQIKKEQDNSENRIPDEGDFKFEIFDQVKQSISHYQVRMSELYEKDYLIGYTVIISDITKQHEMMTRLEHTSRTDGLTNLLNRSYFFERMEYEIRRANRSEGSFAIVLFDIDYFKKINDTWGHQAGDHVLKLISSITAQNLREIDLAGRYGGEEFILFLADTEHENAILVADRIRTNIETANINWGGSRIRVSASFGVTTYNLKKDCNLKDYSALVKKADEALYVAKHNGRNRVEALV